MIVTALQTFSHGGKKYKRGDTPNLVSTVADDLRLRGLVSFNGLSDEAGGGNPSPEAGGGTLSASPAAQAAPQTTSNESDAGDSETKPKRRRKKKEPEPEVEPEELTTDGASS